MDEVKRRSSGSVSLALRREKKGTDCTCETTDAWSGVYRFIFLKRCVYTAISPIIGKNFFVRNVGSGIYRLTCVQRMMQQRCQNTAYSFSMLCRVSGPRSERWLPFFRMAASFVRSLKAMDQFLGQIRRLQSVQPVEDKQVSALCQSLQKLSGISTEDGASMLACLNSCAHVSEAGQAKLMQTIVEKTTDMGEQVVDFHSATAGGKSKLQDYSGLCKFISSNVWDLIMEPSRPACDVLTLICQWAALLGLVAPTEGTMGVLTAIAFWKQWRSGDVSNAAKHRTLQVSKKQIKEHLLYFNQKLPKDRPRLLRLPDEFHELPAPLKQHFGDLLLGLHKCIFFGLWLLFL